MLPLLPEPDHPMAAAAAAAAGGDGLWCEPELLLHSIFEGFSHMPQQPALHNKANCVQLGNMFAKFAALQGHAALTQAAAVVAAEPAAPHRVTWLPEYGAALLALDSSTITTACPELDVFHVFVVGLDNWEYKVHSTSDGKLHPTATCAGHTLLSVGTVPTTSYTAYLDLVNRITTIWHQKQNQKQGPNEGQQSQKKGKGLQRTPAFIHAVARDALDALDDLDAMEGSDWVHLRLPEGGFTDVGLHTGHAAARDTAWPLVREVIQVVLENGATDATDPQLLFQQALVHFELWLLQRQVQRMQPSTASPAMLNACMVMLQSAATKASALASDGRDVAPLEAECTRLAAALSEAAAQRALTAAQRHELPANPCGPDSSVPPKGTLPAAASAAGVQDSLAERRRRAAKNLGSLPLVLLPGGTSLAPALQLLELPLFDDPGNDVAAQHQLRSVERELFRRAAAGFGGTSVMPLEEVAALEELVGLYRLAHQGFMDSPAAAAVMRVEQHSRMVLVAWVAYCMTHTAACASHPVMQRYGVSLHWEDLRHLVLSDREATDAATSVGAYLRSNSKPGEELFCFSRTNGDWATWEAALQFARGDRRLLDLWDAEQRAAAARTAAHWREVGRKQDLVADLRRQRQALNSRLVAADRALDNARRSRDALYTRSYSSSSYTAADNVVDRCQSEVWSIQGEIRTVETKLERAGKAPAPVIQPLPRDKDAALQWLFFLYMPPLLRHLSRASFLAQQLLLPCPLDDSTLDTIEVPKFATSLVEHYNAHQQCVYFTPSQERQGSDGEPGNVMLVSREQEPAQVGPTHVDHFTSEAQGVWYPDYLTPEMGWCGSGSAADQEQLSEVEYFDPFAQVDDKLRVLTFTEQLPGEAEALQWAMAQHGSVAATSTDRGNLALSQQDLRPSWLSKPGYLTFGTLRSYPLGQLRRLCVALNDRCLPLGHAAVGTLVRQLLYHLGTLCPRPGAAVGLLWRTGWDGPGDVLSTLCGELSQLADELEQAPREHDSVLLLGEVAAYLSAWHPPLRSVAQQFATMTSRAADELEGQLSEVAPDNEGSRQVLQARQCFLRMLALLCYGGSATLDSGDVGMMVRLMVLINHGHIFMEAKHFQDSTYLQQLAHLRVRCHNVMASQLRDIMRQATVAPQLMTAAVSRVLQRTPQSLQWKPLTVAEGAQTASYEAVGEDGHLYSVNLLDGTVLLDGLPPSRLPKDITEDRMFRRTFGEGVNFEVAHTAAGVQQTLRPMQGCHYDFSWSASGKLVVHELDAAHTCTLELLDAGEDDKCGDWGAQLPVRLRQLHSHWFCRDKNVIVLRPKHFLQREHHFVIEVAVMAGERLGAASSVSPLPSHTCWRVPLHLRSRHWTQLLCTASDRQQLTDQLVLHESPVKRVLSKMEDPQFIHTYLRHSSLDPSSGGGGSSRGGAQGSNGGSSGGRGRGGRGGSGRASGSGRTNGGSRGTSGTTGGSGGSSCSLVFELPRFGLEFEQRPGEASLVALDYSGYCLAPCQQLVSERCDAAGQGGDTTTVRYTLPEFEQYLVLQRTQGAAMTVGSRRSNRLVLIPAGRVEAQHGTSAAVAGGLVRIKHSRKLDARLQLVYACGTPVQLPGRQQRAHAAQALLRCISAPASAINAILKVRGVAVWSPPSGNRPGSFSGLRLLRGEALEHVSGRLQQQLAEDLLSDPPYELRWMKDHPLKTQLLSCMTDASGPMAGVLATSLPSDQMDQLLALRGLLAQQLLVHALQKRHAVDYGVNRSATARKRLAVPYRAALTSAERSEFAQPDVALLLTRLSYYNDGLSKEQFLVALTTLLRMGESAQHAHYQEWLDLSWQGMSTDSRDALNSVRKLDPSNAVQLDLLYSVYSHNMAAVDYWLNFCVFPYETHQYPQRLVATAWHLVDQSEVVVGFSGTNDNHRLLPLHVQQHLLEEPTLKGTNGKMLDIIQTASYSTLPAAQGGSAKPQWQLLLDLAVREGLDALLDCGALLAGVASSDAAQYLLPLLDSRRFKGVCYHDRGWMIKDVRGRCMPRNSSPISEREAFVLYDDARCRGADLQLRVDAVGLLTLGPGLCKDKLMQAAGRLRQLGRGQTLRIVGTEDVTAKIQATCKEPSARKRTRTTGTTSLDVVQWVMANTVASTQQGVLEWAKQGIHYAVTRDAPGRAFLPELLTLEQFYGGNWQHEAADKVIKAMADAALQQHSSCAQPLADGMPELVTRVKRSGRKNGQGHQVVARHSADEECEREVEKEEEEEEEREREVPAVSAAKEWDWEYRAALTAHSVQQLSAVTGVVTLGTLASRLQPDSVGTIGWSPQIWVTGNFKNTIADLPAGAALNEYLRPVDAVLLFPSANQVLLLSEREADALLELMWTQPTSTVTTTSLASIAYASEPTSTALMLPAAVALGKKPPAMSPQAIASCRLFNGGTSFKAFGGPSEPVVRALREMLSMRRGSCTEAAEALVGSRGKTSQFMRSDLELACEEANK